MSIPELDLEILKSITTSKKSALHFANECDSKLFSPEIWNVANLVIGYVKTYKEVPSIKVIEDKLSKGSNSKLLENVKLVWTQLDNVNVNDQDFKYNLDKLKNRFAEKELNSLKDIVSKIQNGSIDINKVTGEIQKKLQSIKNLSGSKTYESKNIKEYLPTFVDKFNAKKDNPNIEVGLKTGYSFLDFATNGLKPADFVLVAGESGFGKSLLLNNIAIQVWMQNNTIGTSPSHFTKGKNLLYYSLEMPYEDCFMRLLGRLSGVPIRNIENSKLDKDQFSKVKQALDFIKNYPYEFKIIDIADACANDLEAILNDHDGDCDAIFVDYLGIMNTNEKSDDADWLKQGEVSREVRSILRRYALPGFSAVQLNRKTKSLKGKDVDSSANIGLDRLARSGTIATHATHVIQIENRPDEEKYSDFLWHLIKCRKGPKGKGVCYKNLACATLIDKPFIEPEIDEQFTDIDDISEEAENLKL